MYLENHKTYQHSTYKYYIYKTLFYSLITDISVNIMLKTQNFQQYGNHVAHMYNVKMFLHEEGSTMKTNDNKF
jgi:hypothetical protein